MDSGPDLRVIPNDHSMPLKSLFAAALFSTTSASTATPFFWLMGMG